MMKENNKDDIVLDRGCLLAAGSSYAIRQIRSIEFVHELNGLGSDDMVVYISYQNSSNSARNFQSNISRSYLGKYVIGDTRIDTLRADLKYAEIPVIEL